MPAVPSSIIEPVGDEFLAFLPVRDAEHPLGCHRPRIPDCLIFDTRVQVLIVGRASQRNADDTVSATTLRRRRHEWIVPG